MARPARRRTGHPSRTNPPRWSPTWSLFWKREKKNNKAEKGERKKKYREIINPCRRKSGRVGSYHMTSLGRKLEGKVRLNLWVKRLKNGLKISVDLSLLAEELPVPRRATRFSRNFFESIEFVSRRLNFIRGPSRPSCKIKQLSLSFGLDSS